MTTAAIDSLEADIGTHLLRTASWTKPTDIYVALYTTMPAADGTGGVEVSGGSYARVLHGPGDAYWDAPVGGNGEFKNTTAITFPVPTANWGLVVGFGIFYVSSGGTPQIAKTLDTARNIASGDPAPNFPVGSLKITFGGV